MLYGCLSLSVLLTRSNCLQLSNQTQFSINEFRIFLPLCGSNKSTSKSPIIKLWTDWTINFKLYPWFTAWRTYFEILLFLFLTHSSTYVLKFLCSYDKLPIRNKKIPIRTLYCEWGVRETIVIGFIVPTPFSLQSEIKLYRWKQPKNSFINFLYFVWQSVC